MWLHTQLNPALELRRFTGYALGTDGENQMKQFSLVFFALMLVFSVNLVWADPASMKIVRVSESDLVDIVFDFVSNDNGGGFLEFFSDETGLDWFSIKVITTPALDPDTGDPLFDLNRYSFGAGESLFYIFPAVDAWFDDSDMLNILFYDPERGEGECGSNCILKAGEHFGIVLNDDDVYGTVFDPDGLGGWGPAHGFGAVANVPEPATGLLVLAGLGALALAARFRR
jgi:hypothetical protein